VATPRPALGHALEPSDSGLRALITRPSTARRRRRSGLLLGATATACVALTALPGTASADPGPAQITQQVADLNHQLEVISEQVNQAQAALGQQKAAAAQAEQAAAAAQTQLHAMDGQIRQLARSAYTSGGVDVSQLDALMTSSSADQFVSQLGTLDAIAGHTNNLVLDVTRASRAASAARARADQAAGQAQQTLTRITAQQKVLQGKIADYRRQYAALTAPQRAMVAVSSAGAPAPVSAVRTLAAAAPSTAASSGARAAVATALAQVGKPYVWGAAGPNAFDCSGLMQYSWSAAGVALPHSSSAQSGMGTPVSRSQLQPGDLVFFYSPVSHVGMYIGNGQMVHAATSGTPVQVVSLNSMPGYNSARRVG